MVTVKLMKNTILFGVKKELAILSNRQLFNHIGCLIFPGWSSTFSKRCRRGLEIL